MNAAQARTLPYPARQKAQRLASAAVPLAIALAALSVLAGCARPVELEGDYLDQQGATAFRLAHGQFLKTNADGSLYKYGRGQRLPLPLASPYKVDGSAVLVGAAPSPAATGERLRFTILPDGRLQSSDDGRARIYVRK